MGRQPDTNNTPETVAPEGSLTPERWVTLVLTRHLDRSSGTLTIRRNDDTRVFRFIQGIPIMVSSTMENEDFTETMVSAGVIEQARLDWIRKHTGAEESEIEALIGAGTIDRPKVDAHHPLHIQHLVGAGLAWTEGSYEWNEQPDVNERFENSLLPAVHVLESLIGGVFGCFDLGALRTYIDATNAGDFLPDQRLTAKANVEWIPSDMRAIHGVLGQHHGRVEMAENIGCDADRLAAFLWILEAAGWVKRHAPPAALIPLGTVATIQAGMSETPAQPAAAPQAVAPVRAKPPATTPPPPAPAATPAVTATPEPVAASKPKPKRQPKPPTKPKAVDSVSVLKEAMSTLEDGDFDGAYPMLINARKMRPSCPDTLAALGWTAWRTGNLGTNAYDGPEDFLLLALTFDAKHPKALEYYARIAIDKGETETARNRLLQVLQVTPDASWAKEALEESGTSRKGGMRLWPKSNQ